VKPNSFLTRRQLAGIAAAAGLGNQLSAAQPELIKPRALKPGDTVAVVMPSTPVPDPDRLAVIRRTVEHFGLRLRLGKHVGKRTWNFQQSIDERVEDLHAVFADPEVRAVLPVAGGYGAMQILDRLDYGLIRKNPKIFVGYSDITSLHLALGKLAGLVTFHGPMIMASFSEFSQTWYRKALFEPKPLGLIRNSGDPNALRPAHPWRTVRGGKVRAPLAGGNLTLMSTTMGTPYEVDSKGKILLIEDVGEDTYSIDRMLTQLALAGKLQQAAGIVWGECGDCGPPVYRPSTATPFTLGETIDNILGRLNIPVLSGLTIGHTGDQVTLPLGIMATLDADRGELVIEEAATVA